MDFFLTTLHDTGLTDFYVMFRDIIEHCFIYFDAHIFPNLPPSGWLLYPLTCSHVCFFFKHFLTPTLFFFKNKFFSSCFFDLKYPIYNVLIFHIYMGQIQFYDIFLSSLFTSTLGHPEVRNALVKSCGRGFCKPISPCKDPKIQWLMEDFFHCLKIARLRKFSWTPKTLYFVSDWSSHFKSFTLKSKFLFYYYSQFSSTSSNALSGLFLHIPTKTCHKNFFLQDSLFIKLMFLGLRGFWELLSPEKLLSYKRNHPLESLFCSLFSARRECHILLCC